jgi:hypothetical protein
MGRENALMSEGIEEAELADMEQRAKGAFAVAPTPWVAWLETRGGLGGESFIRLGDDPALDQELYIRMYTGSNEIASPDVHLDAVIEFIADACNAIQRLVAEIRPPQPLGVARSNVLSCRPQCFLRCR